MPVSTTRPVQYNVAQATVGGDGSVVAMLDVSLDGSVVRREQHSIAAAVCAPIWAASARGNVSRWDDLKAQLYTLLKAQGSIPVDAA